MSVIFRKTRRLKQIIIRNIRTILVNIDSIKYLLIEFFLRHSLQKKWHKIENCYITCAGKRDGAGAQVQAILSTMLFAQEFGITYLHTSFRQIAHNPLGENWEKDWENFFNLGKDEITIEEIDTDTLRVLHIDHPMKFRYKSNTLYVVLHCHYFADRYPNHYSRMKDRFIEKYKSSSKDVYNSFYEEGKVNIAVHVRRGDVSKNKTTRLRYTDNLYYESLLHKILTVLDDFNTDLSIHLYSQGSIEDFHELNELDINFHLDECAFTAFYNLTSADILVTSKSSFSYSAALLSKSIKIYEPFWHEPLDDWIVASWDEKTNQVIFDKSTLRRRIHSLLARK